MQSDDRNKLLVELEAPRHPARRAMIELILPGGSVMALLLWLYRRRKSGVGFAQFPVRLLSFLRVADPLRFNAAARSAVGSMTASSR
jgi:hypothetical protein